METDWIYRWITCSSITNGRAVAHIIWRSWGALIKPAFILKPNSLNVQRQFNAPKPINTRPTKQDNHPPCLLLAYLLDLTFGGSMCLPDSSFLAVCVFFIELHPTNIIPAKRRATFFIVMDFRYLKILNNGQSTRGFYSTLTPLGTYNSLIFILRNQASKYQFWSAIFPFRAFPKFGLSAKLELATFFCQSGPLKSSLAVSFPLR